MHPRSSLYLLALAACTPSTIDAGATLIRLDPEAPGENCAAGGTAIAAGPDLNNSGELEGAEVVQTAFVCNGVDGQDGQGVTPLGPVLEGTFAIFNAADSAEFSGVSTLTGNLAITAPGLSQVSLPSLTTVQGTLFITNNPELISIELPALDRVVSAIVITNNPQLPTCQAQNLVAQLSIPPSSVTISGNDDAGTCD